MNVVFDAHVQNDDISMKFFHFFKILIFRAFRENKRAELTHNYQFHSATVYISRTVEHIIKIFGTQVLNNAISRCFSSLSS